MLVVWSNKISSFGLNKSGELGSGNFDNQTKPLNLSERPEEFNDILRYLIFLIIPTSIILSFKYFTNKEFLSELSFFLRNTSNDKFIAKKNTSLNVIYFLIVSPRVTV